MAGAVAQTSKSAVSRVSKPAVPGFVAAADLEIGDTAGLETCATKTPAGSIPTGVCKTNSAVLSQ
jgi:hypothetical protein